MSKRGPKPKSKIRIKWSSNFAYAIGLIATDGCVSSDGRHIEFTSKDLEQVENFKMALKLSNSVTGKTRDRSKEKEYFRIQFGDVKFVEYLQSIGITSAKSKTMKALKVPRKYFSDFLRGCFDGDGTFYSYWDKRWKSSFMFYLSFASASKDFALWLQDEVRTCAKVGGHMTVSNNMYQLRYAKKEAEILIRKMYCRSDTLFLKRKRLKINGIFAMLHKHKV